MSYAPAGTPGQHIIVVEAALSRLRERVRELEIEKANTFTNLTNEGNRVARLYHESCGSVASLRSQLSLAMKVVEAAREIGEGPHTEICRGRCGMCRALKAFDASEPVVSQEEPK